MTSKKIAFIGCSFSDYYSETNYTTHTIIGKGSWTCQLAKLYPQHTFRNYSKCGTGIDYHRLCFDECYDWADLIILQRTYPHRRSITLNLLDAERLEWSAQTSFENYESMICNMAVVMWNGGTFVDDHGVRKNIPYYNEIKKLMEEVNPYVATNDLMKYADDKWCENISKDPKVHILNFNPYRYPNAWQSFPSTFNNFIKNRKHWHELGYVIFENDEHPTKKGHTLILNNYILSEELKCELQ